MLISTKDVPLTDGYKRNLRHEGHNLNVTFGTLTVFATFNYSDNYAPLLFKLCNGEDVIGDIVCDLSADQPDMPSLHRMQQLIAESPRAQVTMGRNLIRLAGCVEGERVSQWGGETERAVPSSWAPSMHPPILLCSSRSKASWLLCHVGVSGFFPSSGTVL